VTRDPQLWISPVLCWIFQYSWVHLKAVRVPNMTAKSQVNNFYNSQEILVPRIAGSRLIKHSLITIWPVMRKTTSNQYWSQQAERKWHLASRISERKLREGAQLKSKVTVRRNSASNHKLSKSALMAVLSDKLQDIYPCLCSHAYTFFSTCA